jgi:hypothetical protein
MGELGSQPGASPSAAALHGAHRDIENAGCLGHRVPLHIDEDEGGALLGREGGQGREQFALKILTLGRRLGGFVGFHELVEPLRVVDRCGLPGGGLADPVEAGVDGDAVQPGGDGGLAAEGVGGAEGGDQGVLYGIGRFLTIAQGPQRHGPQPVAMTSYELTEGVRFPGYVASEEV